MSRSGKLISLENRLRSWDGRRLSWRSDRIVAGLREEPTRISRFLTLIWVRILAARRVWTPWRLFCGVGRAGAPSGIYQRTRARHCGVGGPLFRSPSGPPFSAQDTAAPPRSTPGSAVQAIFRARNRMTAVAHTPGVAEATPVRALLFPSKHPFRFIDGYPTC